MEICKKEFIGLYQNLICFAELYIYLQNWFSVLVTGSVNTSSAYINAGKFEEALRFAIPACKYLLMSPKNVQSYSDIEVSAVDIINCLHRILKLQ